MSVFSIWQRQSKTQEITAPPNPDIVLDNDSSLPSESANISRDYIVPKNEPRRIILPTINSEGYIQKVGVNDQNQVVAPNNINFAGWFVDSVLPGSDGLSIIDGHVSGKYADGIFKNLDKMSIGDVFDIEFGDLSKKSFKVVDSLQIPETDAAKALLKHRSEIEKQLNLITCAGSFNPDTNTYVDRRLIIASAL